MNYKRLFIFIFTMNIVLAAVPANKQNLYHGPVYKSLSAPVEHVLWNGNQISTIHGNHGDVASYHVTGNSGLEWPKGSGKLAVFQSGIWLASGKSKAPGANWVEELRSAAAEYTVEFVPGAIGSENTNTGKIYQIQKIEIDAFLENDWATFSSMTLDLPMTVIDGASAFTELISTDLPSNDFANWPVNDGAPWVDVDGDGEYDPENDGDYPEILGDMFHWYVMNDADPAQHTPLWGTPPMNVDVQTSIFGFNQAGAMGNIIFMRWVLINKGSDELDSVFVSMWHDDDVGDATDDLVACNVDLSVGYTYNDADGDATYGLEVPAAGADFFQGPIVDSPGDTATVLTWGQGKGYYLRKFADKKKLGLTSFAKYINGDEIFDDPENAEEAYRYMNGLVGNTGEPFIDPITGEASVFVHDGDPTTNVGWIDDVPGDRRYLMTSGPFYFAPGDTQEVVGAMIFAAGSDWSKSITKMLYFDNFAQGAFDANFDVCSPPVPVVEVAQLDQKIILTFEEKSDVVESYACLGYEFQGYNVYQGASANGPWVPLATYDIVDDVKTILDITLDEATGELLEMPAQFGTDSGLNHFIEITYDEFYSRSLINNRKYYFAVTAYAYDPDAAQRVIESPANAIEAVPGTPGVGNELSSSFGDYLETTHSSGSADAIVNPLVIDPYLLTGNDYEITFFEAGDFALDTLSTVTGDSLSYMETDQGGNQYLIELETEGMSTSMFGLELSFEWYEDSTFTADTSYIAVNDSQFIQVIVNDTILDTVSTSGTFIVDYTDDSGRLFSSAFTGGSADITVTTYNPGAGDFAGSVSGTLTNESNFDYIIADVNVAGTSITGHFTVTTLGYEGEPITQYWRLENKDSSEVIIVDNTDVSSGVAVTIIDGFQLTVTNGVWEAAYFESEVTADDNDSTTIVFSKINDGSPDGSWSGYIQVLVDAGLPLIAPAAAPDKTFMQNDLELRFTENGSIGTYYDDGYLVSGDVEKITLPFELWTVEGGKQINAAIYKFGGVGNSLFVPMSDDPNSYNFKWNFSLMPIYEDYNENAEYHYADDADKIGWMVNLSTENTAWENGNIFQVRFTNPIIPGADVYSFTAEGLLASTAEATKDQLDNIGVFPNPYFGRNPEERDQLNRFVYFTNLGVGSTTIRIFTISGDLVAKVEHAILSENDSDRRAVWDLRNFAGVPVASGMYIAHIDVEDVGEKILKLAIFMPEERLDVY